MPISRKVAQGVETREALLRAARVSFGREGYAATSIDAIVRRAQVTKGAFYHHFESKTELFQQVFEQVKKEVSRAAFVTHVDHEPFADPRERSQRLRSLSGQTNAELWEGMIERCRRYVELHTHPELRRIVIEDARSVLGWEVWQRIESDHGTVLLRADLRRAMRRGLIRRLPLRSLAMIFTGALKEACMLVANASNQEAALVESMKIVEGLLEGLRAAAPDEDSSRSPPSQ